MVNERWGAGLEQEALLARLRFFLPAPATEGTLAGYFGVGYPLFGNAGRRWCGMREMGFPFLVTGDRIVTECYVRALCPEGRETAAVEAIVSGAWKIPEDLHVRVWTPQPKKKGESPRHVLPETAQAFRDAGIRAVEFMNAVKTAENSVRFPDMHADVSRPFFEEWASAMRSGEPYLCFRPERKPSSMVAGLRWFHSVLGISFNSDNRKITEDDLLARLGVGDGGSHLANGFSGGVDVNAPEAVWLWKVREWAVAHDAARRSGIMEGGGGFFEMKAGLPYKLDSAARQMRKTDKARGALMLAVGEGLLGLMRDGKSSDVIEAIDDMREDADLSWWRERTDALDVMVRQNGLNVDF